MDFAGGYLAQIKEYIRESLEGDLADISGNYLDQPGSCSWIAEMDGEIKGMVGIQRVSDEEAELRRTSVASDARGQGIGRKLLDTVENFCRERGYARVCLTTDMLLKPAISLYRNSGYCQIAEETCEDVPGYRFSKELRAQN